MPFAKFAKVFYRQSFFYYMVGKDCLIITSFMPANAATLIGK